MTHRAAVPILVGLVVLAAGARARASQSDPVDVQSRLGADLELRLPKKWGAELEYRYRRIDNLSTYRGSYFTLGVDHKLTRSIDAFASYRLGLSDEWTSYRYAFGVEYEKGLGRLTLGFRPMTQHRTKVEDDDDTGGEGSTFVRTRLQAQYALSRRLDAYVSVEPYFALGADYSIDNWRDTVGVKYELAKKLKLDLYYTYRPDYGKSYNREFHVVGLTLRLKAKLRGKQEEVTDP